MIPPWDRRQTAMAAIILASMLMPGALSTATNLEQYSEIRNQTLTAAYFQTIRDDPKLLRAFFYEMPKGGDIHNHLTGAVYAEDIIDIAASHDLKADPATGMIPADQSDPRLVLVAEAYENQTFYDLLVDDWSMRFYPWHYSSGHDPFFSTFSRFSPAKQWEGEMIQILRQRAQAENVSYIETLLSVHSSDIVIPWHENLTIQRQSLLQAGLGNIAAEYAQKIAEFHRESLTPWSGDESKITTVRYLYEALRTGTKEDVFARLLLAFEVANRSSLVVGVNMVGPEDSYHARADYRLHMQMLEYLHQIYPQVKISLHSGELALGLVPPEDLKFHIREAIFTGNASRIGHGVDIMHEEKAMETLAFMRDRQIPTEILLTSNAQILAIEEDEHPIMTYKEAGVPIVLASDDPGVERTDLTAQYETAASLYPGLAYQDFKEFARNSLNYSFLEEEEKGDLQHQLEEDFAAFEGRMSLLAVSAVA